VELNAEHFHAAAVGHSFQSDQALPRLCLLAYAIVNLSRLVFGITININIMLVQRVAGKTREQQPGFSGTNGAHAG
jgi:hypothetical protein